MILRSSLPVIDSIKKPVTVQLGGDIYPHCCFLSVSVSVVFQTFRHFMDIRQLAK